MFPSPIHAANTNLTASPASLQTSTPLQPASIPPLTTAPAPTPLSQPGEPSGKIVFTCQVRGVTFDQICIIRVDGSGWLQLTDNEAENSFPSLSPDGGTVIYDSDVSGKSQIYQVSASGGSPVRIAADVTGHLYAPEISPDGSRVVFTVLDKNVQTIWLMNRDGTNPQRISPGDGWDPTWSPDGTKILFASTLDAGPQLFTMNLDGSGLTQVSNLPLFHGRSDWSPDSNWISTYAGNFGNHSLYFMHPDGSGLFSYHYKPTSAAPAFSPDGQWIAFTGYLNDKNYETGCEIYIARIDQLDKPRRITNNGYCDYQPRWGP